MSSTANFLSLPCEIKKRIVSFLPPREAIYLSLTCKAIQSSLSIASLPARDLFMSTTWLLPRVLWNTPTSLGNEPRRFIRVPVSFSRRDHSVTLSFRISGMGFALGQPQGQAQIGRIWIIGLPSRETHQSNTATAFEGGRIVHDTPLVLNTRVKITFVPKAGEEYWLWYQNGSPLPVNLTEGVIYLIIYDDREGQFFSKNYRILMKAGILHSKASLQSEFSQKMLLAVTELLQSQIASGNVTDKGLARVVEELGIPVNARSLCAVKEIVQADMEEQNLFLRDDIAQLRQIDRNEATLAALLDPLNDMAMAQRPQNFLPFVAQLEEIIQPVLQVPPVARLPPIPLPPPPLLGLLQPPLHPMQAHNHGIAAAGGAQAQGLGPNHGLHAPFLFPGNAAIPGINNVHQNPADPGGFPAGIMPPHEIAERGLGLHESLSRRNFMLDQLHEDVVARVLSEEAEQMGLLGPRPRRRRRHR